VLGRAGGGATLNHRPVTWRGLFYKHYVNVMINTPVDDIDLHQYDYSNHFCIKLAKLIQIISVLN